VRSRQLIPAMFVLALTAADAAESAAPKLPPAEQKIKDTVDHWGAPFSDQLRAFNTKFRAYEQKLGKGKLDYVLGVETSLRKTFLPKYWFKGELTDSVSLFAARNEAEAFQLAVLPKMGFELRDVLVTASGLTGPNGKTLPADTITLLRVGYVGTARPQYATRHVGMWPDPLLELRPFSVTGTDLGLVWCEVKVPQDAPPGDYQGTLTVRAANSHPLTLTLRLHVWGFALPDRVPMPMCVWTSGTSKQDCAVLLEHHTDPISVGMTAKLDQLDEILEFCFARGLMCFQTIPLRDAKAFRPYYDHIKQKGWLDSAMIYGARDEPLAEHFERINVPKTQEIREAFPGLRVFLASQYYEGMARGCDIHLFDLSTNFHSWLARGRPGKQALWWYFCGVPIQADLERPVVDAPRMLIDRDAVEHRAVYWLAHYYDVKGMFTYAGNRYPAGNENWPAEPWKGNKKMSYPYAGLHNGDGFLIYPGARPSIRLKCVRDGAEDYWYLSKMAALARRGRCKEQARALLDGIRPAVFVDTHYFSRRPGALLEYRRRLGEFIETASRK